MSTAPEPAFADSIAQWLDALCLTHPDRHVGGPGVAAANALFESVVTARGWSVERLSFDCVDWRYGSARLIAEDTVWPLHVGPYSPGYEGEATLVAVSSVEELEALQDQATILFLHGDIAAEQLTPRNYPFYATPEHARILAALDRVAPVAIVAATDRTAMAAALRPFPLFEDADLGFPSAYLLHTEAPALITRSGSRVRLEIDSCQHAATGEQLIARSGAASARRVIVSAHIDSRHGTPGALDNAAGVCVLMALAGILERESPPVAVELLPFNGEDNSAAYGEVAYLDRFGESLRDCTLAINIDAIGRRGDLNAISFYGCDDALRGKILGQATSALRITQGPEWPMSDHMVFAMRGVPAVALTSTGLFELAAEVAHTDRDVPGLVDPTLIADAARFIADVIAVL